MKTIPLGELIKPAKVERAGDRQFPLLSMTMHSGLVDQQAKFTKRVASADTSEYKVIEEGQLVCRVSSTAKLSTTSTLFDGGGYRWSCQSG